MNSVERRNFFEYLCKQKTESKFTENLADKVNSVKTSSDEKRVYMTFEEMVEIRHEEGFNEGKSVGLEQGAYNNKLETAKKLLLKNMSPAEISEVTGLQIEKVMELKEKVPSTVFCEEK